MVFTSKGFTGSVEYSESDKCYFGKLLSIGDLILYEGDDLESLKRAFLEAVEDYFAFCEEIGKIPQTSVDSYTN